MRHPGRDGDRKQLEKNDRPAVADFDGLFGTERHTVHTTLAFPFPEGARIQGSDDGNRLDGALRGAETASRAAMVGKKEFGEKESAN